jgi:YebC/PmpR family DNA-binding regulatory protein
MFDGFLNTSIIKRAIDKVNSGVGEAYEELTYEMFGPAGSTLMVKCLTDNVNRTVSTVRAAFTKTGGTFGASAGFMFERKAYFRFNELSEDEALEALLNAGVEADVTTDEAGYTVVSGDPSAFQQISDALAAANPDIDYDTNEVSMIPTAKVSLTPEQQEKFQHMLDILHESEDVQAIYHNADIDEDSDEE